MAAPEAGSGQWSLRAEGAAGRRRVDRRSVPRVVRADRGHPQASTTAGSPPASARQPGPYPDSSAWSKKATTAPLVLGQALADRGRMGPRPGCPRSRPAPVPRRRRRRLNALSFWAFPEAISRSRVRRPSRQALQRLARRGSREDARTAFVNVQKNNDALVDADEVAHVVERARRRAVAHDRSQLPIRGRDLDQDVRAGRQSEPIRSGSASGRSPRRTRAPATSFSSPSRAHCGSLALPAATRVM